MRTLELLPILYKKDDPSTDFSKLILLPEYQDCLFLFNDNFQDRNCKTEGGNSARIRPYTFVSPPRAMGISTGWSPAHKGFKALDEDTRLALWICFEMIQVILHENAHIRRVAYSCDPDDATNIGYALFKPCQEVRDYIHAKLNEIPARMTETVGISLKALMKAETDLDAKTLQKRQREILALRPPAYSFVGSVSGNNTQRQTTLSPFFTKGSRSLPKLSGVRRMMPPSDSPSKKMRTWPA